MATLLMIHKCFLIVLMICVVWGGGEACAQGQEPPHIDGVPLVQDDGLLIIDGQKVALWGLDFPAPDQHCWQGDMAWPCGENAVTALKHFLDNKVVECQIKQSAFEGFPALAQCFRLRGARRKDVAEHMIARGWALERVAVSGGVYFEAEQAAARGKYGIWSSRFQTAQDWRDGVQRFVGEEESEPIDESEDSYGVVEGVWD